MTIQEMTRLMADLQISVSARVAVAIRSIMSLAYRYEYMGANFSFDADKELDDEVYRILLQMVNDIEEGIKAAATKAAEDDTTIIPFITREQYGQTLTERLDMHASRLREALAAYILSCFKAKKRRAEGIGGAQTYIATTRQHFGQGVNSDPAVAMTITGQTAIAEAYHRKRIDLFREEGDDGYQIFRGSNFPCELCDSVCFNDDGTRKTYTFDDIMPIPVHPRCVCYAVGYRKQIKEMI